MYGSCRICPAAATLGYLLLNFLRYGTPYSYHNIGNPIAQRNKGPKRPQFSVTISCTTVLPSSSCTTTSRYCCCRQCITKNTKYNLTSCQPPEISAKYTNIWTQRPTQSIGNGTARLRTDGCRTVKRNPIPSIKRGSLSRRGSTSTLPRKSPFGAHLGT